MDGYTLTLVIIGAATVAWMFVKLVVIGSKLDEHAIAALFGC